MSGSSIKFSAERAQIIFTQERALGHSIDKAIKYRFLLSAMLLSLLLLSFMPTISYAKSYSLPAKGSRLIGEVQYHIVEKGEYFQLIAERYNVGFLALMSANPGIDPFLPTVGQQLIIPSQMLLPYGKREGIIINLPELRLYYFPEHSDKVHVFPVGVGRQGLATPKTLSYISEKRKDPIWRPTAEMKQRYFIEHGKKLADEIPAGANNPFGKYALRLGTSVYLLHGSNKRFGIGMRASSGCIRLYDDDIEWLYQNVSINTVVRIVDQTIKLSYEPTQKLFEVHGPLTPDIGVATKAEVTGVVANFIGNSPDNRATLLQQIANPNGLVTELMTK